MQRIVPDLQLISEKLQQLHLGDLQLIYEKLQVVARLSERRRRASMSASGAASPGVEVAAVEQRVEAVAREGAGRRVRGRGGGGAAGGGSEPGRS